MSDNINIGYIILLTHLIAENIDEDEQITFNGKTFDFSGIDGELRNALPIVSDLQLMWTDINFRSMSNIGRVM